MARNLVNFIFIWILIGCAINDTGLVKLRYFENDSVRMISKESWGGYLSTHNTDAGFTLGHAERTLIYPKNKKIVELSLDELLTKVEQDQFIEITNKEMNYPDNKPIAWITNNQGLMLHTNQFRLGISLGIESRNVIRLPRDFNGIFVFHSTSDGKFKAYFQEGSPQM